MLLYLTQNSLTVSSFTDNLNALASGKGYEASPIVPEHDHLRSERGGIPIAAEAGGNRSQRKGLSLQQSKGRRLSRHRKRANGRRYSSVIVNDDDVILVDDHVSPAAASVLLDELKDITTKPVRYVINTHFHYDHAHGNQVFAKDVDIIGHEFTREMLLGGKRHRCLSIRITSTVFRRRSRT